MEGPPCGREASAEGRRGPPSAFTTLDPQRSKMSETCRGCRRTGTLERVSRSGRGGVGNPEELLGGTGWGMGGGECLWGWREAEGHRLQVTPDRLHQIHWPTSGPCG